MEIGLKLRALRDGKKMSQGDIEQRTGLLRCYISRVENGHTVPAIETLEKLANALDVPLWQLFHDSNTKATPLRLRNDNRAGKTSAKDVALESEIKKRLAKMNSRDRRLFLFLATKMALASER
jgi:transcriptional regulator with XRE-family HTH domain